MRLLLILALVIASFGFGPTASARGHQDVAEHHSHGGHGDHGNQRDGNGDGTTEALAHICPGCALIGAAVVPAAAMEPLALPELPANPPALASFHANPIPPPPRFA